MHRRLHGWLALAFTVGLLSPLAADPDRPAPEPRPAPGGATAPS